MRLVDSHCHLQADRFGDDVDRVIEAARRAGVERILAPGWNRASSEGALALVDRHPWLHVSVGVHPHDAARVGDRDWGWFESTARDARVVAIGETGLDYDRLFSPVEAQLENLRRNLALALVTGKPAILHCRSAPDRSDAQEALLGELRSAGMDGEAGRRAFGSRPPAILHSFSGSQDYAREAIAMGLAVSFSGLVFRAGEEASAEVASIVPADRVLVETDAPYLAPPSAPRRRNEPEWVRITASWLAEQRGDDPERLGGALVGTYDEVFATKGS